MIPLLPEIGCKLLNPAEHIIPSDPKILTPLLEQPLNDPIEILSLQQPLGVLQEEVLELNIASTILPSSENPVKDQQPEISLGDLVLNSGLLHLGFDLGLHFFEKMLHFGFSVYGLCQFEGQDVERD